MCIPANLESETSAGLTRTLQMIMYSVEVPR